MTLNAGQRVVLWDPQEERDYLVTLQPGGHTALHRGAVRHDEIIGRPEGLEVRSSLGHPLVVLRPSLDQFVRKMPRRTQIIYPKDLAFILVYGDIHPGLTIVEAGLGSGALAICLLRALGGTGQLISYELRPEFIELARRNIRDFLGEVPNHRIHQGDVAQGIEQEEVDRVILDVPEPWTAVPAVARALRPGGTFIGYVPTVLQVKSLVEALREQGGFVMIRVLENLHRFWQVEGLSVRPVHRMVAHTGFLVLARRRQ